MKTYKLLLTLLVSFFISSNLWSQSAGDYRSDGIGNWNNATTWERYNGTAWVDPAPDYPGQNTGTGNVQILDGHTVTLNITPGNSIGSLTVGQGTSGSLAFGNNNTARTLTIVGNVSVSAGASIIVNNNNAAHQLNVGGNFDVTGTMDLYLDGSSYCNTTFNGATQTISGAGTIEFCNLTHTTGTLTLARNISINSGNLTLSGGTFDMGIYTANRTSAGGTLSVAANASIRIAGTNALPINYTTYTFNSNSTVEYYGTDQSITSATYGNLLFLSTGTKSLLGNITVSGAFTLSGQLNATNNITFNGLVNCGGTINATAGTISYGASSANILGGTYYNLTRSGGGTATLCDDIRVSNTLALTSGIIRLGGSNLTLGATGTVTGTLSNANMVETNSTGYFIKEGTAAAGLTMTSYPVGSGGYYTRMALTVSSATIAGTGSIGVRAVPGYIGAGILSKYWDVTTANISAITAAPLFYYNAAEINGTESSYTAWYSATAGSWSAPANATIATGGNNFGSTSTTALTGRWTAGSNQPVDPSTFYSYQTGDWNTASTWTTDPSGTTLVGSAVPNDNDIAVILSGRTVSLSGNVTNADLKIDINNGGFLNMSIYSFTAGLGELKGQGTLQLASVSFPVVTSNDFVETNGGTTEYKNAASFTLPAAQTEYNHLVINTTSGIIATQLSNISLNGNLHVKTGTYRINNDASATKLQLTVLGDVTVDAGASLTVGQGSTNTTITPTGITGGTAPYLNYYEHFHRVVLYGNFTNNGTVRFTNMDHPDYNNFPPLGSGATSGAASVYFMGSTNNTLFCNGTTDFYNLILDKGIDQTYSLTVQPTAYDHFRLFGANNAATTVNVAEPNLMKALWIRTGTLILKGLTVIPSLTEGTAANSDYYIPNSGALVIDGPDVIVLSTADDNGETNVAYNVSGTDGVNTSGAAYQGMVVYGKLQINGGYLSTRESAGVLYSGVSSGLFEITGGTIDAKQFRTYNTTTSGASYYQTGGTLILRGRFVRPVAYASISDLTASGTLSNRAVNGTDDDYGTFNLNFSDNVFIMSGGTVRIYDACGSTGPEFVVDILASAENTSVTGGTFELLPLTGSGLADAATHVIWTEAAPFGNMLVNRGSGCATLVRLRNKPLVVLNDLTLASGEFQANGQDVTIGGDFTVSTTATYSSTNNTTLSSTTDQNFTIDGTINNGTAGLTNLIVDKPSGTLTLQGSQASLTIQNNLDITGGTFADGGKTVYVAGNITHSGTHTGSGKIQLNGTADQTIGGNGSGIFQNLELNNTAASAAPVSLTVNTTINGELTFSQNKLFDINNYNLTLNANASVTGANASRYVLTNGDAGDGSITKVYNTSTSFNFPLGVTAYTPASIGINGTPSAYGSITVIPVDYEHPNVTTTGRSLSYFWRVKSSGFALGSATVTHGYSYVSGDVVTGADITEDEYVGARYDYSTFAWTRGGTGDVDETNNIIGEPGSGTFLETTSFIDGDYTAGDDNPTNPFGTPTIYYSRQSGLWSNVNNWSLTGHTVNNPPATVPGADDIVIIGGNDSIYLDRDRTDPWTTNNVDPRSCATLLIEAGSALDIGYNTNSSFRMVQSHPNGNGNFRLTTSSTSGSTFVFPAGDFSDFDQNMGTTELYSTEPDPGTTYWLPNGKATYGNLILSPLGGSNIIFPNNDVTIYGNLITRGQNADSWFCPTWDSNYPTVPTARIAKTITILGDMDIQGGALVWYGNGTIREDFVIHGDVLVSPNSAIDVWSGATNQNISIGGSLINNTVGTTAGGLDTPRRCDFTDLPVTFFGDSSAFITNTMNSPLTIFSTLTINKGNSQATTLTCDIDGTLTTPANNWLFLENGTFRYMRTNPGTNFTISGNTAFNIPSTAGLYIDYTNASNVNVLISNTTTQNGSDVFLGGKLTLISGNVYIGATTSPEINSDIEYSGSGASAIEIQGGNLVVNGQIRRNPTISTGVLNYTQTGGLVTINGQNANTSNAKLEVLNTGSSFIMTGGNLTLVRGGGTSEFGDLYLRPENSSVTGGTIYLQTVNGITAAQETFEIDAGIALNNLTITGFDADDAARASLSVNPLVLNGSLSFSNVNSYLTTNNLDVSIKGNLTNNGATANYICGTNQTVFNGNTQLITGTAPTNFYNLRVNPLTNLTLSYDVTVSGDLELASGTLVCGNKAVHVKGNIANNATYTETQYGVILDGTAGQQEISGTGTFGRLELNNADGALLLNDIALNKNLALSYGILNIDQYLLSLGQNSLIEGSGFGTSKMIVTNGVFSGQGVSKIITSAGSSFTFPMGVSGKYTPATLTITAIGSTGSVRINNINTHHPAVIDAGNVLQYYWEMESSGINGFTGNLVLNYLDGDVSGGPEGDYLAARLITPGTSWSKTSTVDDAANTITFNYTTTDNLSGEYTAGIDAAFPDNVPVFTTIANGDWNDPAIWTQTAGDSYTLTGGPNGFIVIINDTVEADANFCQAYRTTINGQLNMVTPYFGHNLGTVTGQGTLYLEGGNLPAGRYTDFLDCSNDATLEYGGTGDYIFLADLFNTVPNLILSGTGTRIQPNKDLTICNLLEIDGPTYDNSVNNRMLTILGSMVRTSGAFNSGTGANATVVFAGTTGQTVSDFSGTNAFNNLEIDNSAGLTLGGPIDITGDLLLTEGLVHTTSTNILTIENTSINCVIPSGGSSTSYVSGPLVKKLNQANDYFRFPVGNASSQGNHLSLRYTETGTKYWTVEYINPHSLTGLSGDLTAINEDEYWNVSTPGGGRAIVNIRWTPSSNLTPLMTEFGIGDMRVAEYDDGNTYWVELASTQSGDNYNGSAETTSKINLTTGTAGKYTLSCINQTKPRIRLDNSSPICGDAGIPVLLSAAYTIYADYTISYTLDGTAQTPLTVSSFPAVIPTISAGGTYQLTGFTYNNPAGTIRTGAVDVTAVITYAVPTAANAGSNQSLCGATSATLDANGPYIGTGLWSIVSGTGGTVITPTDSLSDFNGTNGSTYTLRWTITNGTCISSDDVVISFPLLAEQPENFTSSSSNVCQEQIGASYTVPNDPSVTYTWNYTGTGHTINGSDNSVTVDFDAAATSGTLSVTATNTCGTSDPRTIDITVNPLPTITLDPATTEACRGASGAELVYTGTTNSPNQYSINYEAGAEAQGFADITNAALGSSPLTLVVPVAATANTYNATLTVTNSTTGCISHDNSITVTVHALPVPTITGNDTLCVGGVEIYETETGMTNYVWSITAGAGTITPPGDTYDATVTWGGVAGQYEDRTVSVSYTDTNGCSASAPTQITVRVFKVPETGPAYYIPNE